METREQGPLRIEGTRATVAAPGPVVCLRAEDAAGLGGVETLMIPEGIRSFSGLERLSGLRTVECLGGGDVLGLEEGIAWLAGDTEDDEVLLHRLATNLLAAPPMSGTLTAIFAPRLRPPQALPAYGRLLAAIDDLAACSNGRQDSARMNVILCRSYAALKHLEYAFSMGCAAADPPYSAQTAACYGAARPSPRQQLLYALALGLGNSYETFYTADGPHGYHHMRDWTAYLDFLSGQLHLEDTEELRLLLISLEAAGLLGPAVRSAAAELLARARLTDATACLLSLGAAPAADPESEFSL
ncbi:hypothetical protein [Dysosmobacter sp. Phy]